MDRKAKVFKALEVEDDDKGIERLINIALLILIVLNVITVILETVRGLDEEFHAGFRALEVFSVAVFSVEYGLRLWSSTSVPKYSSPIVGRLRFASTPLALIDLLAIAPFYLPWLVTLDLRFVRVVRLFRLLRSLKLARYSHALHTLGRVARAKKEELAITAFLGLVLLILASSLMYYVEEEAQPTVFSSIPAAMWWAIVTLTTVGYGDIYPITPLGRALASGLAILGIGLFALPAGIMASGFAEELQRRKLPPLCPHCGKAIS